MTALTLIPSFDSNQDLNNKGTSLPPWNASSRSDIASLVSNISNWWSDSHTDAFYSSQNIGNNFDVEFQYGQNLQIWASAKFIKYSYSISNEIINPDNSITFDLTMSFLGVVSNKTTFAKTGVSVKNRLYLGSQVIMARDGNTIDNYQISVNGDNPITFKNITLAPRSTLNTKQLQWGSQYPNHEYPDAIINIGMLIYNPLYVMYTPMITRKNRAWIPLNGNAGKILRRVNHYIAYANSADGTDRFTTVYPNLNLLTNSRLQSASISPFYPVGNVNISINSSFKGLNVSVSGGAIGNQQGISQGLIAITAGSAYTMSVNVVNNGSVAIDNILLMFGFYDSSGKGIAYTNNSFSIPADGKKYSLSFSNIAPSNAASMRYFCIDMAKVANTAHSFVIYDMKLEQGSTATPWMPSSSEVQSSDYPSYYGSYYGQGTPSQNASDYSWSPMVSPIPQNEMGWSDFSIETQGTENQVNEGHNRRRTAGQFLQLPKLN